ncbi:WG repeat-containing protein [Cetobacterium sp.]|uniref:WG repeat-containing protein n=1 Tax=Cetobacterium sp. TaxID=2071632 RepID=UPI003F40FAA8
MKKLKRIKLISLLIVIIFIIINLFLNKKQAEKISRIKDEYLKTDIENIFIQNNEKIDLVIIDNNKIKEFKNLDNIGAIKKDNPILIIKDGRYGYIKTTGEELIPFKYEAIGVFVNDKALAKKDGKIGMLSISGEELIPFKYDEIYMGKKDCLILKENGIYFSYDFKNRKILNIDGVYKINEKILVFSKESRFGIMDYAGEIIVPNEYDEISNFIDRLFIGAIGKKYSLYNLQNEKLTKEYDFIEQLGNNEYKGGNEEFGKYVFLSDTMITEERYENINKIDEFIYIGELKNETSDIIELKSKSIKNIKNEDIEKYIKKLKGEKSNE